MSSHDLALAPEAVRADCPDWCVPLLQRTYGAAWVEEGRALAARPPLDLRTNRLKSDRDKVLAELRGTGAMPLPFVADALRIAPIEGGGRHPNVQAEPAFRKGWFEVQDLGSQMAALLSNAQPSMQVLDFCAGAGGKTLALSAAMGNTGQIFAHDAEKQRLAPIFDRLQRAGCRNVQVAANPADLKQLEGGMDLVLVDAPCTGSGTWRRRPDAKWRLSDRQLAARCAEQSGIIDAASNYVKPGGRLAYVTCSVFAEENVDQIAAFRARSPEFQPVDHLELWRDVLDASPETAAIDPMRGIGLSPLRTDTDGFFIAVLQRT